MATFKQSRSNKTSMAIGVVVSLGITILDFRIKPKRGGEKADINAGNTQSPSKLTFIISLIAKKIAFALSDYFNQLGYLMNTVTVALLDNPKAQYFSDSHFSSTEKTCRRPSGLELKFSKY